MKLKALFTLFLFITSFTLTSAQYLVSWSSLGSYTDVQVSTKIFTTADYGVTNYKITYNTTDVNGSPTVASGAVIVPDIAMCDLYPLVSYQHGTVLHKDNVPSRNYGSNAQGMGFAGFGFIVSMPDFLGLGDNPGLHPYHHSETQGSASVDMMRAAREFVEDTLGLNLNGEVFLAGYSQGGHATMALHQYIEDNNLTAEFNIVGSVPMSGAYNLSGVQAEEMYDSVYASPGYLPYIIESYELVYGDIYNTRADVYDSPYDVNLGPYFNGTQTLGDLNSALPSNVFDFMQDTVLDNFIADSTSFSHPLRVALAANDNYDWAPAAPVRMLYCEADEQVSYRNSLIALDSMTARGATDVQALSVGAIYSHSLCFLPAMTWAKDWFETLATPCINVTSVEEIDNEEVRIDFVMEEHELRISTANTTTIAFEIVDTAGKIYQSGAIQNGTGTIDIRNLKAGIYIIKASQGEKMYHKRFVGGM